MSKELTEQWRNGTLEDGDYYVRKEYDTVIEYYYDDHWEWTECEQDVKEVLAPVPTYDQFSQLVKKVEELEHKLEIATKALKTINRKYRFTVAQDVVYKALKEMKGLK